MTQADVDAFNIRQAAAKLPKQWGEVSAPTPESKLHEAIFADVRRRGWIALHGAMSQRTHRTAGEPDFVILADNGRTLFIECKSKIGKLSTEQQAMACHAYGLGHKIHCCRSVEDYLAVVNEGKI